MSGYWRWVLRVTCWAIAASLVAWGGITGTDWVMTWPYWVQIAVFVPPLVVGAVLGISYLFWLGDPARTDSVTKHDQD